MGILPSCSYVRTTVWLHGNLISLMKWEFFQAVAMFVLLFGCTIWILTKYFQKIFDGIYTRMLHTDSNKSQKQQPIQQQLYGHFAPLLETIQVKWTRHAGHCWKKNGWTHKPNYAVCSHIYTDQSWPTSKDPYLSAL